MTEAPVLTRHQSLVLEALTRLARPVTAYSLLEVLRDDGLRAPPQIYRALEKLLAAGLVHRVESLNAFVVCAQSHDAAVSGVVALAICERCGLVEEFPVEAIDASLRHWSAQQTFALSTAAIELRGTCARCQSD